MCPSGCLYLLRLDLSRPCIVAVRIRSCVVSIHGTPAAIAVVRINARTDSDIIYTIISTTYDDFRGYGPNAELGHRQMDFLKSAAMYLYFFTYLIKIEYFFRNRPASPVFLCCTRLRLVFRLQRAALKQNLSRPCMVAVRIRSCVASMHGTPAAMAVARRNARTDSDTDDLTK